MDPWGEFKVHGNWCGPDWTGKYKKSWNQLNAFEKAIAITTARPKDAADKCCKIHDICYGNARASCNNQINRDKCLSLKFNVCDYRLFGCLKKSGACKNIIDEIKRIAMLNTFIIQPAIREYKLNEGKRKEASYKSTIRIIKLQGKYKL